MPAETNEIDSAGPAPDYNASVDFLKWYAPNGMWVLMAIATDNNPGTSPYASLLLMLNMACTAFRLTPEEALAGVTREAARALGMQETHGTLQAGKGGGAVLWDVGHPAELAYSFGHRPRAIFRGGVQVSP